MSSFDDRKDAFEKKYAHDEALQFRVEARTAKLVGLWAAEQMGLGGADAETYAKAVVEANLEMAGYDDVKQKLTADLTAKGVDISAHNIDSEIVQCEARAKQQIIEEE